MLPFDGSDKDLGASGPFSEILTAYYGERFTRAIDSLVSWVY